MHGISLTYKTPMQTQQQSRACCSTRQFTRSLTRQPHGYKLRILVAKCRSNQRLSCWFGLIYCKLTLLRGPNQLKHYNDSCWQPLGWMHLVEPTYRVIGYCRVVSRSHWFTFPSFPRFSVVCLCGTAPSSSKISWGFLQYHCKWIFRRQAANHY